MYGYFVIYFYHIIKFAEAFMAREIILNYFGAKLAGLNDIKCDDYE